MTKITRLRRLLVRLIDRKTLLAVPDLAVAHLWALHEADNAGRQYCLWTVTR